MEQFKILYIGPLNKGGTCLQRMQAMKDLRHEIVPVDTEPEDVRDKQSQFIYRVKRKLFGPSDLAGANYRICQLVKESPIDILWLDKALTITPETVRIVRQISPKTVIAGYSPDDMLNPDNQSKQFLKGLKYYDIFFTTKSYGVEELKRLGCKQVEFIDNAYDPHTHKPMKITKEDRVKFGGSVGFIGAYERERAESILYLAKQGFAVRVWGQGWNKKNWLFHPNLRIENIPLWGEDYSKAICSFDINLNFLRRVNRDLQTTRSIEIPACGGFMLAERTNEHLRLFEEGKEAEFFSTNEDLLEKVQYYLRHEDERNNIAQNGHERCLRSGYSNHKRLQAILDYLYEVVRLLQNSPGDSGLRYVFLKSS